MQPTSSPYIIQSGDTLSGLAQQNKTSVENLMKANPNITNPDQIYAGYTLNLPGPAVSPEGTVNANSLHMGHSVEMPAPTAPQTQANYQTGVQRKAEEERVRLESLMTTERDAALKRQDDLNQRLEKLMQNQDPESRATYAQEQRIIENQLRVAEQASAALEDDFARRRAVVSELETLLTQGNELMKQASNSPVAMSVLNKSVAKTMSDITARAGVLQAVLSGLDGNLGQAHNIINNARAAVASSWQDSLAYHQTYMKLVEGGQLAKNKIHDAYAQAEISLAKERLDQLDNVANYINGLMIDPKSAQFMASAGITLNDSIEEINAKMAEQAGREEREGVINELTMKGYEFVPYAGDRTDVVRLDISGQSLAFLPPEVSTERVGGFEVLRDGAGNILTQRVAPTGSSSSSSSGSGDSTVRGMSISQIDTFRRNYGWTPPAGASWDDMTTLMNNNPSLTPKELEAVAKELYASNKNADDASPQVFVFGDAYLREKMKELVQTGASPDRIKEQVLSRFTVEDLFPLAKEAGQARWYSRGSTDVNRYLDSLIQEARQGL